MTFCPKMWVNVIPPALNHETVTFEQQKGLLMIKLEIEKMTV